MASCNILILGGTVDARQLAGRLAGTPGMEVTVSLAGRTAQPRPQPGHVRVGGFGGAQGLARYLKEQHVDVLVDATHPFATRISASALEATRLAGVPMVTLARHQWEPLPGDEWIAARDVAHAASLLGEIPSTVFLAIGRQEVAPFATRGRHRYIVRSIDPVLPEELPNGATVILDRGPFDVESERRLLEAHRVDIVVSKNSGGTATYGKIAAARTLHLPVVMIERSPGGAADAVYSVEAALERIRHLADLPAKRGE